MSNGIARLPGDRARSAPLAESEEHVYEDFASRVELTGADVVEIGGAVPESFFAKQVRSWNAIDPRHSAQERGKLRLWRGKAERLPLPDECADAVFSSNAFQFLDFGKVLAEAHRVLRPGGILHAHFGPVWNGPDGHQLEYVDFGDRPLLFWQDTYIPEWAHLRYTREEFREVLASGVDAALAEVLTWHVFDSGTVNRLFFEDYVDLVGASEFEALEISASTHLDYEIRTPEYPHPLARPLDPAELAELVAARAGRPVDLQVRDVRLVLRKP